MFATALLTATLCARRAPAQQLEPTQLAARAELLEQARARSAVGDHRGALDAADRAGRLQMTPSVRMFIAQEQAVLGLLAQGASSADLCIREVEREPTLRSREAIEQACRELSAALRPRVGRVTIRVPNPAPVGLRVTLEGRALSEALYGVPVMVTPGVAVVEFTTEGRPAVRREVRVSAGVVVEVGMTGEPAEEPSAAPAARTMDTVTPRDERLSPAAPATSTPRPAHARRYRGPGAGPIVLLGLGGASVAASIALFVLRERAVASLEARCSGPDRAVCPASAMGELDAAITLNTAGIVTALVGGVALAGTTAWWALSPRNDATTPPRAFVAPTAGGVVVGLGGSL